MQTVLSHCRQSNPKNFHQNWKVLATISMKPDDFKSAKQSCILLKRKKVLAEFSAEGTLIKNETWVYCSGTTSSDCFEEQISSSTPPLTRTRKGNKQFFE